MLFWILACHDESKRCAIQLWSEANKSPKIYGFFLKWPKRWIKHTNWPFIPTVTLVTETVKHVRIDDQRLAKTPGPWRLCGRAGTAQPRRNDWRSHGEHRGLPGSPPQSGMETLYKAPQNINRPKTKDGVCIQIHTSRFGRKMYSRNLSKVFIRPKLKRRSDWAVSQSRDKIYNRHMTRKMWWEL